MDIAETIRRIHELTERINAGTADESDLDDIGELTEAAIEWRDKGGFWATSYDRALANARAAVFGDAA